MAEEASEPKDEETTHSSTLRLQEISDGLKIKQGQKIITSYTYGHGGDARPVDWKILAGEDELVEGDQIRCLQLKEGEDLDQLVQQFQSVHAKAIIFVNTREDFVVEAQQWPRESTIPVLLLKASNGKELLSTVENNNDIYGKVHVESHVDGEPNPSTVITQEPTAAQAPQPIRPLQEQDRRERESVREKKKAWTFGLGEKHSLNADVKQLMFSNDTPVIVSEDIGTFTMIMSTFQQYEKTGKGDGSHGDLLKKLVKCLNNSDVFEKDFPFYLVLAHRIKSNRLYFCEDSQAFLGTVLNKIERLDPQKLSSTLNAFLQRGDFPIMFGSQESNSTVFKLLENACLELSVMSLKQHKLKSEGVVLDHLAYTRMVWVSIALKCHSEAGTVTRSVDEICTRYLVQIRKELVFNPAAIESLRRGLKFTKLLNIPPACFMSSEHMIQLAKMDDNCVRPLSHLMNYLDCIAEFITNTADIAYVVTTLRAHYQSCVSEKDPSLLKYLSIEETVSGAIQEGIIFVDKLSDILKQKEVREELNSSETLGWLVFLLRLVDVTKPNADEHLTKFFSKGIKSEVLKSHRPQLTKDVIERTKQSFPQLPIHLFFSLYKKLRIWPYKFVEEYLGVYKVPQGMKICDGTWEEFISVVIDRHSGAHNHHFLLEFIKKVGDHYGTEGRHLDFIIDLLDVKVPKLFALPDKADKSYTVAVEVQSDLLTFVQTYINLNNLKAGLLNRMSRILVIISKEYDEFQQLILTVLQKEVTPELRGLQNHEHSAQEMVTSASTELQKDLTWIQALNPRQKFCWGIIANCCSKTFASITANSFDWIHTCDYIITQLGQIFVSYSNGKKIPENERTLIVSLPQDIISLHSDDVTKYFEWIKRIQGVLLEWQAKIVDSNCNYDDILMYANNQSKLFQIGQLVCSKSAIIAPQSIQSSVSYYLELFENVNCHLIKYIPGNPDAKYCTLPQILHRYGVTFPPKFTKHLLFPGEEVSPSGEKLLLHPLIPSTNGRFQPQGQNISLQATKGLTMKELIVLTDQLDQFTKPILEHMDMLVFFSLHPCEIFNNYMRLQLQSKEQSVKLSTLSVHTSVWPSVTMQLLPKGEEPKEEGVSLQILIKALNTTKSFLSRLIQGTATYSEIIIEGGTLTVESINIEAEFNTLAAFFATVELTPHNSQEGLKGICSMLELFQYTSVHIPAIHAVCEQYKLEGCLNDPNLKSVVKLAEQVEERKADMTPLKAVEKLQRIKTCLYPKKPGTYSSLGLFSAVSNSAAFYQFVRDKKFDDEKGQAAFGQQYQLITAQLQHEEYNENVLNHLYAAYKFIIPFMDTQQSFESLMSRIVSLDISGGLKQLETVNSNITLIRLWFSRAEGDTLQNVAKDLDCIIQTGHYQFEFSSNEAIDISLYYCPAMSAEATVPSQPSSFGEGTQQKTQTTKRDDKESKHRWSKEQIDDFVRKLGFLDAEKEGGEKIKHFLHINETANTMLKLYTQLRDLGCADFTKGAKPITLQCMREDTESLVHEIETKLSAWKDELSKLCDQNVWMLFFRTPKLLLLYKELCDWMALYSLSNLKNLQDMRDKMDAMNHFVERETRLHELRHELSMQHVMDINDWVRYANKLFVLCNELMNRAVRHIVREVSFLCANDSETLENMRKKLEITLKHHEGDLKKCHTPMLSISMLLSALLQDHQLPTRIKTVRKSLSTIARSSITLESSQVLHSCPGFTQKELIPLILNIFGGIPEPFQIFRCQSSSTQEELGLFLQRATKFGIPHLVLEVNKLPFHLQEHLMKFHLEMERGQSVQGHAHLCLQYIETKPTNLRDIPWITFKEHKVELKGLKKVQYDKLAQSIVQLVYGHAGDGKTHYIKNQLSQCPSRCTITVNEAFTPLWAIKKLRRLPSDEPDCAIFFNFTLLPSGGNSFPLYSLSDDPKNEDSQTAEHTSYQRLIDVVGWFFFELLILGYVEDKDTGLSFRLPGGLGWAIYVEVPSRDLKMTPEEMLEQFRGDIPTLSLVGSVRLIPNNTPFVINEEVQLVCKYLKAYKDKKIDQLYKNERLVKFSMEPDIAAEDCQKLLNEYMPDHIKNRKITQRLFVKYMNTRCHFLDRLPAFNYNLGIGEYKKNERGELVPTNTRALGSTLMEAMLKEVSDFCDPSIKENWSLNPHQQLIYDMSSIDLITLHADKLSTEDRSKFTKIGVNIPSMMDMHTRGVLDKYLSKALGVDLKEGRLKQIDDASYVLTLDYTLKMLNIHERYRCGVPVIIEGETGVGKTALVQMLSVLWNHSLLGSWNKEKGRIHDLLTRRIGDLSEDSYEDYGKCVQLINQLSEDKYVCYEDLQLLCNLPGTKQYPDVLYTSLRQHLLRMRQLAVVGLLVTKEKTDLSTLFAEANASNTVEATARLLQAVYFAQLKSTFYKLNIHAALTPHEIQELLKPAFDQARELQQQLEGMDKSERNPFVTVFLDEVNTSSCLGLLKEFIVDRTLDGEPVPENVFIVAACNPQRGNSMASHEQEKWLRGSYFVRPLHPTLQLIMWDYGSLDSAQESDYIRAKIKMLHKSMSDVDAACLTDLIVDSQEVMRHYAERQLRSHGLDCDEAKIASHSCVSQRDIQRVFILHEWLMKRYTADKPYGDRSDNHRRAMLVALGIVYYMRLNTKFREAYKDLMDKRPRLPGEVSFSKAFTDELDWYIDQMELPQGIAKTQALKENIFATIICTVTRIPLIIVGAPGSSKTLSFNITVANLKGQESKTALFRHTGTYPSLDPHYYQCSRRTTSNEIQTVFSRAINRQKSHLKISLPINCVVFMDEAGLPEESHESLKVLHYYLDNPEVSFVAITNHVLDAAKTNRAISLFRPESSKDDLETLAKGCLCSNPDNPPPDLRNDLTTIARLCVPYQSLMEKKEFKQFFGLRDFIHFVNYLRRKHQNTLTTQVVMEALERNFNGSDEFEIICKQFLPVLGARLDQVPRRQILDILHDSLADRPSEAQRTENEVRYKLIIDPSEDDSLVRLLFTFGILDRQNTRVFVCSDFPGDTHLQKINTIAAIRHSAIEGHTVVMAQTDDIHESFYDLFNQRFRRIDDTHGPRYYANIAIGAHSKPCRVHPEFQCVVVVKQSEVKNTPAPFLNRFEKYRLTHHSLLEAAMSLLPPCMAVVINTVREKVNGFVGSVGEKESFYGLKKETTDSLLLSLLPTEKHTYCPYEPQDDPTSNNTLATEVICLQQLIQALRSSAGFHIPTCSLDELTLDAQHVSYLVCSDSQFQGLLQTITPQGVVRAVAEAMQKLHEAPAPQNNSPNVGLSPEGCVMVAMVTQLLVRHLCKRLMQLMTPEALTVHRNKIDFSYLISYLKHHSHFSLKVLISDRLEALKHTTAYCPTKLLCYTRTSSLIHKLPLSYSGAGLLMRGQESAHDTIRDLVLDDLGEVMLYKLSNKPQSSIRDLLKTFTGTEHAQVLLLIANMAEATVSMVNHLRIMIEEAENQCGQSHKLFVLLLHFPPHNFLNHCYPTLYLRGWDHYYLDTIGHHIGSGGIDVEEWFSRCCFPHEPDTNEEEDPLIQTAKGLLEESIPIISSRVPFGSHAGFPFNGPLTISQREGLLRDLLVRKEVGGVLCKHFLSYWKPNVMSGYLEQAASLAHQQQSTLNISDTIQAAFKASFMDFIVVMVSRMNENCNIDSIFANGGSPAVDTLFKDLLSVSPLPLLTQLKVLSNNLQSPCIPEYVPLFPFFHLVMNHMDQLIEQCRRDANEGADVLGDVFKAASNQPHSKETQFTSLCERMLDSIRKRKESTSKDCIVICMQALTNSSELWSNYFNHFIFSKLHLTGSESTIEKQIVQEVFGNNLSTLDIEKKIVHLHAYVSLYTLDLAKVATILRSLAQLQKIKPVSPNVLSPPHPSPTKQFMYSVRQSGSALSIQQLSIFVVSALFKALLGCTYGGLSQASALEQLKQWFKAYQDIVTLPSLSESISAGLSVLDESADMELTRAQFNVMQTTFSVIQCKPDCDSEVLNMGQKVFCTLFTRHFKESGELKDKCPQLAEVYQVAVECIEPSEDDRVHRLIERLFNHFFPANSANWSTEDCRWFLAYANSQNHWLESGVHTSGGDMNFETAPNGYQTRGQMSINVFKLYLSRILGKNDSGNVAAKDSLAFYNDKARALVGKALMSAADLGAPTHYIPIFYQQSTFIVIEQDAISKRMQQPLAHLYFLLLMEHLAGKQQTLPVLLHTFIHIAELCMSANNSDEEKVLLYIEQQAVLQAIVQQVALHLDPAEPKKIKQLGDLKKEVNAILDDPTTGGGACKGHTLVLALHLLKRLKSFRKFTDLLTVKFEAVCQGINCLDQFSVELKQQAEPKAHLFPFMVEAPQTTLGNIYQRVHTAMLKINDGKGSIDELSNIGTECFKATATQAGIDTRGAFRMAVWLSVYYNFYDKGKSSQLLCNAIGGDKLSHFFEEGHIAIIQRFLNPELMLTNPELPNPLREDEEVLMLQPGGRQAKPKQRRGKPEDPLVELFRPPKGHSPDQSDVDLRHALANMVAMVIGSPKASNHLWYHMFAPEELVDTYMTGFMYDNKIKPNELHYDCGVELSPEGHFGHQDYLKHAGRGTYTLHSLYLLLWANFGAFCVALLTQPNADKKVHGPIISDWLSIRHYCVSQLRTIWLYMRNNLKISDEERSFLLMRCMTRFHELCTNPTTAGSMQGKLSTREQLDSYERVWHSQIYQPSWAELKEAYWQNPVFHSLRSLDELYPHFATEKDFIHSLLSSGDISLQKQGGELYLLTHFVLEYPQLKAGGRLLPDLVEFYLWLHTQLAYTVSHDKATELKIGQVVERAVERYSEDFGTHVKKLYERVKVGYNAYVETIGHAIGAGACVAVCRGNKVYTITDDMPLLHFLSGTPEKEEGNDWLYTVIADIVSAHNNFIQDLYMMTRTQCLSTYHLLPSEPSKIPLTEFTLSHCIVGKQTSLHDINDFLQLVRSRYRTVCVPDTMPPKVPKNPSASVSNSLVQQQTTCQFDLHLLQQDVVAAYLAGKPPLESAASIRTQFKFRSLTQQSSPHPTDVASSGSDIDTLGDQLPGSFKVPCDDSTVKKMEFEFHSAGYLTLLEVVQVMKNVLGHLVNLIKEDRWLDPVKSQTVQEFMAILDSQRDQKSPVFPKSSTPTLSEPQLKFVENLSTVMVFSCLQHFIQWLKNGMYDFHTLPFALKTHLSSEDQEALLQIPGKWKGDMRKLLDELKALTDSLVHSEAYFTKNTNDIVQMPMKKVLVDFHFVSQEDNLPTFIPPTVCVQHYVAFRVVLRRLVATVPQCDVDVGKVEVEKWQEFVEDIWDKHLPHFRDVPRGGGMSAYDPRTGRYGFAEELEEGNMRPLPDVLNDDITADDQETPQDNNEDALINDSDEWEVVSSLGNNIAASVDELKKKMQDNPCLRDELASVPSAQKEKAALEELAENYSVDDVVDFLHRNRMDQYIEMFKSEEIDGTLLVDYRETELKYLGITSPLHLFKIQFLFKRTLQKIETTHALVEVLDFLNKNKMDEYRQQFCDEGVDGDMLLEIIQLPNGVGNAILEELGVKSPIHMSKMRKKFKPSTGPKQ